VDRIPYNAKPDNVFGGTRYVKSRTHFLYYPGNADDHTAPVTDRFDYQQMISPVSTTRDTLGLRGLKVLRRKLDVTFICP
jgi:hypothetical protein